MESLPSAERRYDPLPAAYGRDRAAAFPRDPGCVFVLWELTADGIGRAKSTLGAAGAGARLVLRWVDGGGREGDVPVSDWLGRYRLFGVEPGARLRIEVGFRAGDGAFSAVVTAAEVEVPRDGPAAGEVRWVEPGARRQAAEEAPPDPAPEVAAPVIAPPVLAERSEPVATDLESVGTSSETPEP